MYIGRPGRQEPQGRGGAGTGGMGRASCRAICFLSHLIICVPGGGQKSASTCMAVQSGMVFQSGFLAPALKIKRFSKV